MHRHSVTHWEAISTVSFTTNSTCKYFMVNTVEVPCTQTLCTRLGTKLWYASKKDANLRSILLNVRLVCSCTASWKASSENRKASSKDCWLHTPIHSEMQCSFAYRFPGAAFRSFVTYMLYTCRFKASHTNKLVDCRGQNNFFLHVWTNVRA